MNELAGVYRAVVQAVDDPNDANRIQVLIPQLGPNFVTGWANPATPSNGSTQLPSYGDIVWVLFEGGDPEWPVWMSQPLLPPFANAQTAGPFVQNNAVSNEVYGFSTTLVMPVAGTVRMMATVDVAIPLSSFQAVSLQPQLSGTPMSRGGTTSIQIPSSSNEPILPLVAVGTLQVVAGSYAIQALISVGGGGANVTMTNLYVEAQQVA